MDSKPFRPAREIAIDAHKQALHDPANYDPGPPPHGERPAPEATILQNDPPMWSRQLLLAAAALAATGIILRLTGVLPLWGLALTIGLALVVLLAPVLLADDAPGRHRRPAAPKGKAGAQ